MSVFHAGMYTIRYFTFSFFWILWEIIQFSIVIILFFLVILQPYTDLQVLSVQKFRTHRYSVGTLSSLNASFSHSVRYFCCFFLLFFRLYPIAGQPFSIPVRIYFRFGKEIANWTSFPKMEGFVHSVSISQSFFVYFLQPSWEIILAV